MSSLFPSLTERSLTDEQIRALMCPPGSESLESLSEFVLQAAHNTDKKARAEQFTEIMSTARAQGVESQLYLFAAAVCQKEQLPELWETPKPFDGGAALAKLTKDCLPPFLWEYLQAVSNYVQVAPEMALFPLLSVLSLCVQGKAFVQHPATDHTEPLNLYTVCVASPGERKSGCLREFTQPVYKFQRLYNERHRGEVQEYRLKKEFYSKQRDKATNRSGGDGLVQAQQFQKMLSELTPAHELTLIIEDTTPEALAAELAKQNERISILDDEGSIFDVLSGLYTNGTANINIFLKGYDGEPYIISRRTSESVTLSNPLLTIGLMVQPSHFTEAMRNKQFAGRGFIHRFIFAFPESLTGSLSFHSPNIDAGLRSRYESLIFSLLEKPYPTDSIPVLTHSAESSEMFENYFEHLQKAMRKGGRFENMREWASKHFARALRLAGIFQMVESCDASVPISLDNAMCAIRLSAWEEEQAAKALSGEGAENETVRIAKQIIDKLRRKNISECSKSELISRHVRGYAANELKAPLELLEDMNYIRVLTVQNGRGKPQQIVKVNPALF